MKKLLMMAAALFAFAAPARADQLPTFFLGEWCGDGENYYSAVDEPCAGTWPDKRRLTIKRNGLNESESCRFRSIKKTNDLRANSTKPTKADWTPVVEILALCTEGDGEAVVKLRLVPAKGGWLSIERKTLRYLS